MDATNRSLVEHLGSRVMEWYHRPGLWSKHWFVLEDGEERRIADPDWDPTQPSAATWEVWKRAREMGVALAATGHADGWAAIAWSVVHRPTEVTYAATGPRALCEAVARATGWKGEKE